jgi:hypothetical protein
VSEVEVRHNVVYRSYHVGTCIDGDPNGDPTYRPSGIFAGGVTVGQGDSIGSASTVAVARRYAGHHG